MLRTLCILLALGLLAACAATPPAEPPTASRFTGVPGSNFHATSANLGFAPAGAGFGAPTGSMGSPASVGHFDGAMGINSALPTSDFHPSGLPAGYHPR